MSGLTRLVSDLQIQASLRRSKLQADIVETQLRRSRVQANLASEEAMRRSRNQISNQASLSSALRRSRIQATMQQNRAARQEAIKQSRIQSEILKGIAIQNETLSRSRRDTDNRGDKVSHLLKTSKMESEIQNQRLRKQRQALNNSNKKRI